MARGIGRTYAVPAGGEVDIQQTGRYVAIISTTSPVDLEILNNNSTRQKYEGFEAPFVVGPVAEGFTGVKVRSSDGSAQTVKVAVGADPVTFQRVAGTVSVANPDGFTSQADIAVAANTVEAILAADSARVQAVVTNLAASVNTVRVGDANVAAGQGTPLEQGQSMTVIGGGAISVYNPAGGVSTIACTYVTS